MSVVARLSYQILRSLFVLTSLLDGRHSTAPLRLALCLHRVALEADNLGSHPDSNASHHVAEGWDSRAVGT